MKLGICAYPLSKGKETGRGLDRVVDEFCAYLTNNKIAFDFYERGLDREIKGSASTKEELKTILLSFTNLLNIKKTKNDCYFGTYPVASIFPILASKKPLVTAVHDLIPFFVYGFDNDIKYAFKRRCIKYSCKKSDYLIVPFTSTKNKIIEMFGTAPEKIFVIPYGVNHKHYFPDSNVKKKPLQVAFLGEAKRAKGMDSVIKAFQKVTEAIPEAKLILASQGNELEQMKKLAEDLLPVNSYEFAGFINECNMREFYNSTQVFVFPSRYGFGLSALEAMACGTPTIVGATLDALDFISDPDLLADPDKPEDIANKIIKLLSDKNLYETKSKEAIELAQNFSWDRMAKGYYKVCEDAVKL